MARGEVLLLAGQSSQEELFRGWEEVTSIPENFPLKRDRGPARLGPRGGQGAATSQDESQRSGLCLHAVIQKDELQREITDHDRPLRGSLIK